MTRALRPLFFVCGIALVACTLPGPDEPTTPPIAEGFPQLEPLEEGRGELQIDGKEFIGGVGGGGLALREDGFEDELRASITFDGSSPFNSLVLQLRGVEVGSRTLEDGDFAASYSSPDAIT